MKHKILILLVIPLLLVSTLYGCAPAPEAADDIQNTDNTTVSTTEGLPFIFNDHQYSYQALRAIAQSSTGGADIGECLSTIYKIDEGDDESWYREWLITAERVEQLAQDFQKEGDPVSARECYLRASNYYRTAEFFLYTNPEDPRIVATWEKSHDCFLEYAGMSVGLVNPVEIPFEDTTLPGYFCLVDKSGIQRPLLIMQTGFDGTAEELYIQIAQAALKRGFNCLIFEGPGQGQVIRIQHIPFRPDWETVVTPVVDFALEQPAVDPEQIALMGISFGGYFAPRAAAYEPRIKVCIANGGVYDFHERLMQDTPPGFEEMLDDPEAAEEIDRHIYEAMETDPSLRWSFSNGMWTFGAGSPSEWMRMTRPYNMRDHADMIECRMLIVDSEDDRDMPGQAKQLYDALTCPKEFMLFTTEEGAGEHCQVGAYMLANERILNWLQGQFVFPK